MRKAILSIHEGARLHAHNIVSRQPKATGGEEQGKNKVWISFTVLKAKYKFGKAQHFAGKNQLDLQELLRLVSGILWLVTAYLRCSACHHDASLILESMDSKAKINLRAPSKFHVQS